MLRRAILGFHEGAWAATRTLATVPAPARLRAPVQQTVVATPPGRVSGCLAGTHGGWGETIRWIPPRPPGAHGDAPAGGARHDGARRQLRAVSAASPSRSTCACSTGRRDRDPLGASSPARAYRWQGYLPGAGPRAALRLSGPRTLGPGAGARCNPAKLLLDPYARAIAGERAVGPSGVRPCAPVIRDRPDGRTRRRTSRGRCVSGGRVRLGRMTGAPRTPLADSVIYELHVKGFTKLHPDVPDGAAGHVRRAGPPGRHRAPETPRGDGGRAAARPPVRPRLRAGRAGPAQLLGLQVDRLLRPAHEYASAGPRRPGRRVQTWSATLHDAGLEVILDVVFNHTAEGSELGPDAVLPGIDNAAYYRLADDRALRRRHRLRQHGRPAPAAALRLVMDSLRYWVQEMHVDGFRFDLAASLGRAGQRLRSALRVPRGGRAGPGARAGAS